MSGDFVAANALEQVLLDAQEGRVQPTDMFDELFGSKVYVLINKDPGPGGQWGEDTSLLVLNNQAGSPVVAMFTSLERTEEWPGKTPGFGFVLEVDFAWLINGVMDGVGVVLNPGCSVGVEMAPELVGKLQETLSGL